jgi:hypothetical protein
MVKVDVVSRKVARANAWLNDAEEILSRPTDEFLAGVKSRWTTSGSIRNSGVALKHSGASSPW